MSDTDDTDNLLLIPPDLFTVTSDTEDIATGPYYKVVENLITQVSNLENRINTISSGSDSSINPSLDYQDHYRGCSNFRSMSGPRKYSSLEDLSQEAKITPQKSEVRINSLPTTPNVQYTHKTKSKLRQNGNKATSETLNEIDTFISNVKTIQKFQSARNLNSQFNSLNLLKQSEKDASQGLNLLNINEMLENVERQQRSIENRLKETETELNNEKCEVPEITWQGGDTVHSILNYGVNMQSLFNPSQENRRPLNLTTTENLGQTQEKGIDNALDNVNMCTLTSTGIFASQNLSDSPNRNIETCSESRSLSSSDSTPTTAYQGKKSQTNTNKIYSNAVHALDMHNKLVSKNNNDNTEDKKSNSQVENNRVQNRFMNFEPPSKNTLVMMKLSDLWNHSGDSQKIDHSKLLNRLQEEYLRRQHCEQIIQRFQTKTLELQEKLAVAIQVDGAKDNAISQIHKSWEEAATSIDELCTKNSTLERIVSKLEGKLSQKTTEAEEKIRFYEKESSKALNLAQISQERLVTIEKENNELSAQLQSLKTMLKDLQDSYNVEKDNVKQLSTVLCDKEYELKENKIILAGARKEISQSKKTVQMCQTELTSMVTTKNELERQLNDKLNNLEEVEKEKQKVLVEVEGYKKKEKSLQEELNKQNQKMDQHKLELRNFYQGQVEIVVREKLQEFQLQLEKAENSLQDELHNRELGVAKAAALYIQQITEKHTLEIHLIQEKHKEEIKLYKLQLSKSGQHIDSLLAKLQQQQERKGHIAQQLHKVMEAQWLEALKILNSKTPISHQERNEATMDQLNSLKSRSYNNVEEILLNEELKQRASGDHKNTSSPIPSPIHIDSHINDYPQTPLTSRPPKTKQQLDQEMQKYIQMLLSKLPGPSEEENSKRDTPTLLSLGTTDNFANNFEKTSCDGFKSDSKIGQRDRLGKPPWK